MKHSKNMAMLAAVFVATGIVFAQEQNPGPDVGQLAGATAEAVPPPAGTEPATPAPAPRPRLVDLGADKCIPCKMMAPILEELKTAYAGQLQVDFIDVWKNPDAGDQYGIRIIPTQIFFDAQGKELFRHEGFFAKEDILAKWRELGCELR